MNSKTTPVLVILLIIAAFLVGTFWTRIQSLKSGQSLDGVKPQTSVAPAGKYPILTLEMVKKAFNQALVKFGDVNNKLVFVEVSDPSCPYCHAAAGENGELNKQLDDRFILVSDGGTYVAPVPEMKKLVEADRASLAYLYFPGHGVGEMGTKALYCAFEKDRFWEVHDKLMTNEGYDLINNVVRNDKNKSGELVSFLKDVIDQASLKSCLESGRYDPQLTTDTDTSREIMLSGNQSDRIGTPAFFVNSTYFNGAYSYKDIEGAVDAALAL